MQPRTAVNPLFLAFLLDITLTDLIVHVICN